MPGWSSKYNLLSPISVEEFSSALLKGWCPIPRTAVPVGWCCHASTFHSVTG